MITTTNDGDDDGDNDAKCKESTCLNNSHILTWIPKSTANTSACPMVSQNSAKLPKEKNLENKRFCCVNSCGLDGWLGEKDGWMVG
jgi:hypothetical protein